MLLCVRRIRIADYCVTCFKAIKCRRRMLLCPPRRTRGPGFRSASNPARSCSDSDPSSSSPPRLGHSHDDSRLNNHCHTLSDKKAFIISSGVGQQQTYSRCISDKTSVPSSSASRYPPVSIRLCPFLRKLRKFKA